MNQVLCRPAAVVFDMDGLLFDSERIARDGFLEACRDHGVEPDPDLFRRCLGTNEAHTRGLLVEAYGAEFPLEAMMTTWDLYCETHLVRRPPPMKPGAITLLATLRRHAIPCALATSTDRAKASAMLEAAGLGERFPIRVCGDEVVRSKPDPEIYGIAVARLAAEPQQCWALEDSANGVRAAVAAGLEVIQIPDLVPPEPEIRALGHQILRSLHEVDERLRRLAGAERSNPRGTVSIEKRGDAIEAEQEPGHTV